MNTTNDTPTFLPINKSLRIIEGLIFFLMIHLDHRDTMQWTIQAPGWLNSCKAVCIQPASTISVKLLLRDPGIDKQLSASRYLFRVGDITRNNGEINLIEFVGLK